MSTRIEELNRTAAFVGALQTDPVRYGKYNCTANRALTMEWIAENGYETSSPASVIKAFESFESTGVPSLAVLPNVRVEEERRAKQAADSAAAAEAARLAEIAEANERDSLLREVAAFHYRDRAQQESAIRNRFAYWSLADLRREAEMRRLARDSRNQSAEAFALEQGLTEKKHDRKDHLVLPQDLTPFQLKLMSGANLRLLIKRYVVAGYPEKVVMDAITRRLNEVTQ